jgi:mannose-6-phosphate isomerase
LAGQGLDEVLARWPEWILGEHASLGRLPLLLKILNVGQWLSVQVHPGDEDARRLEGEPWGKSEAWSVLAAQPGAEMILGLAPGTDREGLAQAMDQGRLDQALNRLSVKAGDTFLIQAGTVHSPGPGLTLFEVQQSSDVTYRLYDWDRPGLDGLPRPLHQEKALQVLDPEASRRPVTPRREKFGSLYIDILAANEYFSLRRVRVTDAYRPDGEAPQPRLWLVLSGSGRLGHAQGGEQVISGGQCWLLPTGLQGLYLQPKDENLVILESLAKA